MTTKDKLIEKRKELNGLFKINIPENVWLKIQQLESEIASLKSELAKEPEVDINTPFFGNSGVKVPMKESEGVTAEGEIELRKLFKNLSDCYADTWHSERGFMEEGEVIQAMTEERFIEAMETLNNKKEPEGVTAEEILRNTFMQQYKESFVNEIALKRAVDFIMLSEDNKVALSAMESYAKSKQINRREELNLFIRWFEEAEYSKSFKFMENSGIVDIYLNQKDK